VVLKLRGTVSNSSKISVLREVLKFMGMISLFSSMMVVTMEDACSGVIVSGTGGVVGKVAGC